MSAHAHQTAIEQKPIMYSVRRLGDLGARICEGSKERCRDFMRIEEKLNPGGSVWLFVESNMLVRNG